MYDLVPHGHPTLHCAAKPVAPKDIQSKKIRMLVSNMKDILRLTPHGVALAAPQVGEPLQIFVVRGGALDGSLEREGHSLPESPPTAFFNPEIIKSSRATTGMQEGCLSLPGLWGVVPRAEKVTLRAHDENGKRIARGASGLLAQIFQHEVDHINGILYTDKATQVWEEAEEASRAE
jgi:peptide deformylase